MNEKEYSHMYSEEESHWWYAGMRSIVLSLLPPANMPGGSRFLDAGCGTGYNLGWLHHHYGAHVTGLDFYPTALAFSWARGERNLVLGDASILPFRSDAFDLVTAFDVLTHINRCPARLQALSEFRRVLKPGGRALIRVAAFEWLRSSHDEEILTYHRYDRSELRAALLSAGFDLLRLTFANCVLFPAAVVWRSLKKAQLAPAGSDVRPGTRGFGWTNSFLRLPLELEASILKQPASSLPVGLSLLALVRKPRE